MAKKLVIELRLEDEDDWRCSSSVRRVILPREIDRLRAGPRPYVVEEAGRMWDQLTHGEEYRHG